MPCPFFRFRRRKRLIDRQELENVGRNDKASTEVEARHHELFASTNP
jgi:hypothetical protein